MRARGRATVFFALLGTFACGASSTVKEGGDGGSSVRASAASAADSGTAADRQTGSSSSLGSSLGGDASLRDAGDGAADATVVDAPSGLPDAPLPDVFTGPIDGGGSVGPYGTDGPEAVTTATLQVPSPNGTFSTIAYIPGSPGPHPVVILSSGFFQTAAAYAPYANRLASWGVVTLLRDDPNLGESTAKIVSDVQYTVGTWLGVTNASSSSALHGAIDTTKVGLAGHSRGGQVALLAGEGLVGKIQCVFGLDPVDDNMGSGPLARTTLASIGVPLAFIGETTDGTGGGGMPCAPLADNFEFLYGVAKSPAVAITAVHADHTMFEAPAACNLCSFCTPGTASQAAVLGASVRYLTAFFARQLLGDTSVGAAFGGAGVSQDEASGLVSVVSK